MIRFDSDYMAGAHPEVLERLVATNMELTVGYGNDEYCAEARALVREACSAPDAEVMFLVGGTQTNAVVIDGVLRCHEGVLAAESGHIAVHESGAIEASGHKVLTLPHHNGKLVASEIDHYIEHFYGDESFEHMVFPGMVYISQPTEYGTLYSLAELEAISQVCRKWQIPLFVDGARLGYALSSPACDVTLEDLARLCDVFYIGGTKVGALMGEAVVARKGLLTRFFTIIKQQGALLAKGWLLGLQFDTLFTDGLYLKIAAHAVSQATRLREALEAKGYRNYYLSPTNQIFLLLSPEELERVKSVVTYTEWERLSDGQTVIRLATSWATRSEEVDELIEKL
jgi:threonine aldolase